MHFYKISRSIFPIETLYTWHTETDGSPRVIQDELLVRRLGMLDFGIASLFFADTAIVGNNKDSMRNDRALRELVKFNVFIIVVFSLRFRTKRDTIIGVFLRRCLDRLSSA